MAPNNQITVTFLEIKTTFNPKDVVTSYQNINIVSILPWDD